MTRAVPSNRMGGETVKFPSRVLGQSVFLSAYRYPDGRLCEVAMHCRLAGSDIEAKMYEWAALLSLALQHGMPLEEYAGIVQRAGDGTAKTVFGECVDELAKLGVSA
jgi:hypothetical protein